VKAGVFLSQRDVRGFDGELAAGGHGVARIHGQIHDDLLDLPGIGAHRAQGRRGDHYKIDIFADDARKHLEVLRDHRIQIENFRRQHLLAAESE
jgi:hypothetical protein